MKILNLEKARVVVDKTTYDVKKVIAYSYKDLDDEYFEAILDDGTSVDPTYFSFIANVGDVINLQKYLKFLDISKEYDFFNLFNEYNVNFDSIFDIIDIFESNFNVKFILEDPRKKFKDDILPLSISIYDSEEDNDNRFYFSTEYWDRSCYYLPISLPLDKGDYSKEDLLSTLGYYASDPVIELNERFETNYRVKITNIDYDNSSKKLDIGKEELEKTINLAIDTDKG